jgi:hypothetical protein
MRQAEPAEGNSTFQLPTPQSHLKPHSCSWWPLVVGSPATHFTGVPYGQCFRSILDEGKETPYKYYTGTRTRTRTSTSSSTPLQNSNFDLLAGALRSDQSSLPSVSANTNASASGKGPLHAALPADADARLRIGALLISYDMHMGISFVLAGWLARWLFCSDIARCLTSLVQ